MRGARARTSERRVLVALLLATALVFCHGVFGVSHALAGDGVSYTGEASPLHKQDAAQHVPAAHAAVGHVVAGHAATPPSAGGEDAPAGHAGSAGNYFAMLLVFAAVLGLLRAAVLVPVRRAASQAFRPHRRLAGKPFLPRGASPPFSQVFRL